MGQHYSAPYQPNSTQPVFSRVKAVPYFVFYNGAWWGMLCLAFVLLVSCALLAGLTLAVCGLNATILHVRSAAGTPRQRQQALVVAGLKRHHTWMLCSLIICSVLCGESLPFVVQSLWDKPEAWVPIIISTLVIGFFAEIAPQYFVPRHAIEWGYYCWPILWGCMWITCILSWPIAKLLDYCSGLNEELGTFSNDELASLIKCHDVSEKYGGSLSQDATSVMLGALSLDGRKIGACFSSFLKTQSSASNDIDTDIEKADLIAKPDMVTDWSLVKTVDINEAVDKAFIKKLTSWSYSRIPVVGEPQIELADTGKDSIIDSSWGYRKIFGFLHIKNLISLELNNGHDPKTKLFVRDLPLYPLPIVTDDLLAYHILDIFHLGMSRMAVVVRAPARNPAGEIVIPKRSSNTACLPTWTGTQRTNMRIKSRQTPLDELPSKFFLELPAGIENREDSSPNVVGIRCLEPLGIITFEDIIDAILQKPSRDETEFYNGNSTISRSKQTFGHSTIPFIPEVSRPTRSDATKEAGYPNSTLRRRNFSNKSNLGATMDGVNERSVDSEIGLRTKKSRKDYAESSYTQNSRGGFHGGVDFSSSIHNSVQSFNKITPEELANLGNTSSSTPVNEVPKTETVSLPTRKATSPSRRADWNPFTRRYASAMPILPGLRRVTPFSRQDYSTSIENYPKGEHEEVEAVVPSPSILEISGLFLDRSRLFNNKEELTMPCPSMVANPLDSNASENPKYLRPSNPFYRLGNASGIDLSDSAEFSRIPGGTLHSTEDLISDGGQESVESPQALPYDGFPPELLDRAKENQVPKFTSRTMPRTVGIMCDFDGSNDQRSSETHTRETSFHDDRALLPSQRRALNGSAAVNMGGIRSASFWF